MNELHSVRKILAILPVQIVGITCIAIASRFDHVTGQTLRIIAIACFFTFAAVMFRISVSGARQERRLAGGLCPHCGYDLRATPERCPECGKAPRER